MNISQAAQSSGLSAKALRHYESIGLVVPSRAVNGYRNYSPADVEALCFVSHSRACGFATGEVRALLELRDNPDRRSWETKALVSDKLSRLEEQLQTLLGMRATLQTFADSCAGNESPDCAILEKLSGQKA
ncbi:MerR family transcriptional regulator [Microbulbifer sp. OS29]|uniref:MerR family transcriptional regulator n=1 Tax=Microbulbifer okhotskensis TaxID=2926617 RepID=A0A9X2J3W3_9GAMM|nr:MerR family transcriptional regulator [Microbulbifer okhotskensis]MCO1333912.1 MerR family transcriptional regulator [Microbulbifer okhotskensis]